MTIANFKTVVAAYLNRTSASLVVNSQDLLLQAMNDARRAAQRMHMFELLRTDDCYLTTSSAGANWTTGCVTTPGGGTALLMRRIDEVWNYGTATTPTTNYPRTTRIPFGYTGQFRRDLPIADSQQIIVPQDYTISNRFAYAVGERLFVTNTGAATTYKILGIKWLDDLTGSENPDIFLTYYTDWFKYATLGALNVYLKDSERFPIDATLMSQMWESVKAHDGSIANMGESIDLD
jgi:hypothetical protein